MDIEKEAEFGVAVKGESSCFYLSAFLEIVGQTRQLIGFGLLRILSWSAHCILIQMVREKKNGIVPFSWRRNDRHYLSGRGLLTLDF